MSDFTKIDDGLLAETINRFASGGRPAQIVKWLREEHGIVISREDVHKKILPAAKKKGILVVVARLSTRLETRIADKYGRDPAEIHVVDVRAEVARAYVTSFAARLTARLIDEIHWHKRLANPQADVHIGLGGGETVCETSKELGATLRQKEGLPRLIFQAMSSGFSVENPLSAPSSFFLHFVDLRNSWRTSKRSESEAADTDCVQFRSSRRFSY